MYNVDFNDILFDIGFVTSVKLFKKYQRNAGNGVL